MTQENSDMVSPVEFGQLQTEVESVSKELRRLNSRLEDQTSYMQQLLEKKIEHSKAEDDKMWDAIGPLKSDTDNAHEKIRGLHKSLWLLGTLSAIFIGTIQGMSAWYLTSFIDRADRDHDLLVKLATQYEYLENKVNSYERRLNSQGAINQPGNSGDSVYSQEWPAYPLLQVDRVTLEEQQSWQELYSSWSLPSRLDFQPSLSTHDVPSS